MIDMSVDIAGIRMKNPVTTASGTFGSGREYAEFIDLNRLGAVTVKGVSAVPWEGNQTPRVAETYSGMLNAIGLQNKGAAYFLENELPFLKQFDTGVIVNICGHSADEYREVTEMLRGAEIDGLELNISCPNISEGGLAFGTDPKAAAAVVRVVRAVADKPLIVKLSPNVTDITEIARAVEDAGANAISLINTLQGMKIDIYRRKTVLARGIGGLSGPAIMPVAVRMVNQVYKAVKIPIIGMGGITTGEDAIEFIMAGASAVAVGTANFMNPRATIDIIDGIQEFLVKTGVENIAEICGIV